MGGGKIKNKAQLSLAEAKIETELGNISATVPTVSCLLG